MPNILFYKYCRDKYPDIPNSTRCYLAKQGLTGIGPFSGAITMVGKRFYIDLDKIYKPDTEQSRTSTKDNADDPELASIFFSIDNSFKTLQSKKGGYDGKKKKKQ